MTTPAPFAIDAETGHVRFPDLSLELRPQMPQQEFIAASAKLVLRHRILINYRAEAEGTNVETVIKKLLETVKEPSA